MKVVCIICYDVTVIYLGPVQIPEVFEFIYDIIYLYFCIVIIICIMNQVIDKTLWKFRDIEKITRSVSFDILWSPGNKL